MMLLIRQVPFPIPVGMRNNMCSLFLVIVLSHLFHLVVQSQHHQGDTPQSAFRKHLSQTAPNDFSPIGTSTIHLYVDLSRELHGSRQIPIQIHTDFLLENSASGHRSLRYLLQISILTPVQCPKFQSHNDTIQQVARPVHLTRAEVESRLISLYPKAKRLLHLLYHYLHEATSPLPPRRYDAVRKSPGDSRH